MERLMQRPAPGTLVWQRMADDRGLLIGGATRVLQVAEPAVGAGVEQHSNFRAEPWRRLYGTLASLTTWVEFAARVEASSALPPALAARLGLELSDREQRRLPRFTGVVAALRRGLPRPLRPGPAALLIHWRSRRRWDAPPLPSVVRGAA
jgi:uncharacterized protein (DUF2236 family)